MQSLTRDPAPSRLNYRLQRWLLTPAVRVLLRVGVPWAAILLPIALYFASEERREALLTTFVDLKLQIEARPEFQVRLMAIDGASDPVATELREILPLHFPVSSFDIELEEIRLQAETLDAVAQAAVRIRSGGVLQLDVVERAPQVVWRGRGGLELLDGEGHRVAVLEARAERADMPLLAGDGANNAVPEALELLRIAEPINPRIRGLLRVGERRWDVVLDRDQRIMLPETGASRELERVIAMDAVEGLLDRDLTVIDMRNPGRPTLRMGPAAAEAFRDLSLILFGPD